MRVQHWLRLTALAIGVGLLALVGGAPAQNVEEIEARMRRDITFLASPECEGRGPGTKGIDLAADYIAAEFKKSGLKPGGVDGTWFQPFTIGAGGKAKAQGSTALRLKGPKGQIVEMKPGQDYELHPLSGSGKVEGALVFAGYGVTAPGVKYDDYKDLDVAGKVVVLLRRTPRANSKDAPFDPNSKEDHGALQPKFAKAESRKAAAILLVNDASEPGDKLTKFGDIPSSGAVSIPVLHVRREVIDTLLRTTLGRGLYDLERDIDHDLKPRSAALQGWGAGVESAVAAPATIAVKNVLGVLEGSGPLANEIVVVGGHYDHLGYGSGKGGGKGGAAAGKPKAIYHGADDNASGTTSVIELARRFAAIKNRQGRKIVFMLFSAEERGLLGSRHYCNKEPLFPLNNTVGMVNLDMVGRLPKDEKTGKDKLITEGLGTAKGFEALVEKFNEKHGFQLVKKMPGTGPSDHDSFCRKDVPVFFLWNGTHKDYHKPSDTAEKINVQGMRKIADLAEDIIKHLTTVRERPEYVKVAAPAKGKGAKGKAKAARLGITPNYADDKEGLLIEEVAAKGPADKAGLKAGDRIVEMAGQPVRNVEGYTVLLSQQQPGREIAIVVQRGGKTLKLKITPE